MALWVALTNIWSGRCVTVLCMPITIASSCDYQFIHTIVTMLTVRYRVMLFHCYLDLCGFHKVEEFGRVVEFTVSRTWYRGQGEKIEGNITFGVWYF
jgi:hypothetical protein